MRDSTRPTSTESTWSRSAIMEDSQDITAHNWLTRRLPPLKSYLPSLGWTVESSPQHAVRADEAEARPPSYSDVPLTPESGRSRSVIGTPVTPQRPLPAPPQSRRDFGNRFQTYWDIV
ncbi:hypothetical protein CcaCcLH18_07590 [Colletotrichum camelliae]|nr:hypothetical protein CcaCcLH18_07590 [Colletotrichum camelliae]